MPTESVTAESARDRGGRNWRILSIGLLGFSSGLPLALSNPTLQAWFTTAGLSLKDIGWVTLTGTRGYASESLNAIAIDSSTRSVILGTEGVAGTAIYRLNNPDAQDSPFVFNHHWRPWVYGLPFGGQPVKAAVGQYENGVFYYYIATWGRGIWKREARGGDF